MFADLFVPSEVKKRVLCFGVLNVCVRVFVRLFCVYVCVCACFVCLCVFPTGLVQSRPGVCLG